MEVWPKPKSMFAEALEGYRYGFAASIIVCHLALLQRDSYQIADRHGSPSREVLAMDGNLALEYALRDAGMFEKRQVPMLPVNFWV